jgi:hypothetical protein
MAEKWLLVYDIKQMKGWLKVEGKADGRVTKR